MVGVEKMIGKWIDVEEIIGKRTDVEELVDAEETLGSEESTDAE